ncbi:hypothetical protein [Micromonospora sp. NPDC047074]
MEASGDWPRSTFSVGSLGSAETLPAGLFTDVAPKVVAEWRHLR